MPTHELVVRTVPCADEAHRARLVTLLAVALDRSLSEPSPTVDLFPDLRVYPVVPISGKGSTS